MGMTSAPFDCDLLVHGGVVLTADAEDTIIPDGAVAIVGTRILAAGRSEELQRRCRARETIDARGGIVHPGFIDAHIHISQYTSRSVLPRMEATAVTMGDWKAALRPEDEHASATLAAVDYLRSGYTGFVDPGTIFEPDAVAAVAEEVGIRIWLTDPYIADRGQLLGEHNPDLVSPGFLARWPKDTDEALKRLGRELGRNEDRDGLVQGFIGLYGEDTASPELYAAALDIARRTGVQFQEHRGYNPKPYRERQAAAGRSAIQALAEAGVLGPGTTFVHMNVVHAGDVRLLTDSRTAVVWCPYSQLRMMGTGEAEPRMRELARAGCAVGLATDIPRTVNFDALGTLAAANAAACGTPLHPSEFLRMRTVAAAATVGAHDVGRLAPGMRADIVIRSPDVSETLGLDHAMETAVLGLGTPPAAVIVNGKVVLKEGVPLRVDPAAAARAAHRSARSLLRRIGL
jgi:cytosine/adenosine deaminase-related metal-dependent hydrolase